jgi:hypothetical protein
MPVQSPTARVVFVQTYHFLSGDVDARGIPPERSSTSIGSPGAFDRIDRGRVA